MNEILEERSGGICEAPSCTSQDFRGLQRAHITHRKMGGCNGPMAKIIGDPRNVAILCAAHHDILDGRVWKPKEKEALTRYLKELTGWEDWKQEHTV